MKTKYINLALALVITCAGLLLTGNKAEAEEYTAGWTATYTGDSITTDFDQDAVNSTLTQMMPGDNLELDVAYKNSSSKTADFYMASDILSSLESGNDNTASGGAYSYSIVYNDGTSTSTIYDSDTIGGDNTTVKGLMQAAASNGNYFYVGEIPSGSNGTVTIKIALDGNSQTNSYMNKIASLGITFAVEDVENSTRIIERTTTGSNRQTVTVTANGEVVTTPGNAEIITIQGNDVIVYRTGSPQTGDSMLPLIICAVAVLFGILLIIYYFFLTKKQNKEKEAA